MESNNSDANHIGAVLLVAMSFAAGIALGSVGRDSERLLIAQQSREITQLQAQLVEAKAKFEGYQLGRR